MSSENQFIVQARNLIERGFAIAWVRPGEKRPTHTGWSTYSQKPEQYVAGNNLGIVNGWLSTGGISQGSICIDLDSQSAQNLADSFLPPTDMIDGRPGKPRTHRWYRVTDIPTDDTTKSDCQALHAAISLGIHPGPRTRHFDTRNKKRILDFLGTGGFSTCPPSVVSDETRLWYADGNPTVLPFNVLMEATEKLLVACDWIKPTDRQRKASNKLYHIPPAVNGQGGRAQTWNAARFLVNDCALIGEEAWPVFLEYNETCEPPWPEDELRETLKRAIEEGPDPRFPHGQALKPDIQIGLDQTKTIDEAIRALLDEPALFQRDGNLVHIVHVTKDEETKDEKKREEGKPVNVRRAGSPRIVKIEPPRLSEMLSSVATWKKYDSRTKKEKKCLPPDKVVNGIFSRNQWNGIRELTGVVEVPVLRPDGTLLSVPGYDHMTGLFYDPNCLVSISPNPTPIDAKEALKKLLYTISDFHFDSDAHIAGWLAFALTPFSRFAFSGHTPLFLVDAPEAGSGKGLLTDIVSLIYNGRRSAITTYTNEEAELRKLITALAMAGDMMVVFDNVEGKFGSGSLNAAITGETWKNRELGGNKVTDVALTMTWAATGNNTEVSGDLRRRVLPIRLVCKQAYPEDREDFKERRLCDYVRNNRSELVSAVLTILRAYIVAERPNMRLKEWGSFESWSDLIRSTVVWIGFPDPNEARVKLRDTYDPKRSSTDLILTGLEAIDPNGTGVKAVTFVEWCVKGDSEEAKNARVALVQLGAELTSTISVGVKLKSIEGVVIDGRQLVLVPAPNRGMLYAARRSI